MSLRATPVTLHVDVSQVGWTQRDRAGASAGLDWVMHDSGIGRRYDFSRRTTLRRLFVFELSYITGSFLVKPKSLCASLVDCDAASHTWCSNNYG